LSKKELKAAFGKSFEKGKWLILMRSNNKTISNEFKKQSREMRSYYTILEMAET
jgi:hypothetical protein